MSDIGGESLTVSRTIWHLKEQSPKTENANRTLALSPQLIALIWDQIERQRAKRACIPVRLSEWNALGYGRVSQTQAASTSQVSGNPKSGFSRLPAFQCFTVGRVARSIENDSGAHRSRAHQIVHWTCTAVNLNGRPLAWQERRLRRPFSRRVQSGKSSTNLK